MNIFRRILAVTAALGCGILGASQIDIGDLLKVGGVAAAVRAFGPEINKAANKLQNFSDSEAAMTKVVPIISVGTGGYIGAAQVMGPPNLVRQVKAVAQLETRLAGNMIRIKALIPISAESVTKINRVAGVGVSAVIDLKI